MLEEGLPELSVYRARGAYLRKQKTLGSILSESPRPKKPGELMPLAWVSSVWEAVGLWAEACLL